MGCTWRSISDGERQKGLLGRAAYAARQSYNYLVLEEDARDRFCRLGLSWNGEMEPQQTRPNQLSGTLMLSIHWN